jgi:hypothetical protein
MSKGEIQHVQRLAKLLAAPPWSGSMQRRSVGGGGCCSVGETRLSFLKSVMFVEHGRVGDPKHSALR